MWKIRNEALDAMACALQAEAGLQTADIPRLVQGVNGVVKHLREANRLIEQAEVRQLRRGRVVVEGVPDEMPGVLPGAA